MNQVLEFEKSYLDEILQEAKDSYHKIKSIYNSTGYSESYKLGQMWEADSRNMRDMISIINSDASAVDSVRLVQDTNMFSINPLGPVKEKMVDWYIACLRRYGHNIFDLDLSIQESPVTNPAACVTKEGRLLSPDFLQRVIFSLEIQKYCVIPKSNFHIVELGGGGGNLARTLKLFIPNSVYVGIDIPEMLYFTYLFLKLNFPHAKACFVSDPSQLKDGLQGFDFVFISTIFAEDILEQKFDLFCNTFSLGEMLNPVIRYWMHFVQNRLKVKYFFSLNRFLCPVSLRLPVGRLRLDENECAVLFDANWRILHWELEPAFNRCPIEIGVGRHLEIIAERLPEGSTNESDNQLRSQQIVEDVMFEDWIRFPNRQFDGVMLNKALPTDFTMSGTLFKLWESIRLYPNKTNVAMMIIYLHTLTKTDCPLQEWFYYKKSFENLLGNCGTGKVALCPGITLLDNKYERIWKYALELSKYYDKANTFYTFNITRFLPSFLRSLLIKLLRPVLIRLYRAAEKHCRVRFS